LVSQKRLELFAKTTRKITGEGYSRVVVVGGVVLRFTENLLGLGKSNTFSGPDLDVMYCTSNDDNWPYLQTSIPNYNNFQLT
jgi:hypothetical protein